MPSPKYSLNLNFIDITLKLMTLAKNSQPLVTILMPVYNAGNQEEFLDKAVKSIISQTYQNWELICIDDHSSDNTPKLLKNWSTKDSRIKYILNAQEKGISGALNTGIEIANGEFIARMDADDISQPERIERQVNYLMKYVDRIAVGCHLNILNEKNEVVGLKQYSDDPKFLKNEIFRYLPMPHPAMLVRSEILKQCRYPSGYPTSEDVDLFFQMLRFGDFGNVQEPLYSYRLTSSSNSFKRIKSSLYYTIKARLLAIRKYHYRPSFNGILYTFIQAGLLVLPASVLQKLYIRMRLQRSNTDFPELLFQILKYGIVGVITVLLDIATFTLLTKGFGVNYLLADVLDTPIFLSFNYFAHKLFTFENERSHKQTLPKYTAVILFNQAEALLLLWLSTTLLGADPVISKIIQTVIQPLTNFVLLRMFVFGKKIID